MRLLKGERWGTRLIVRERHVSKACCRHRDKRRRRPGRRLVDRCGTRTFEPAEAGGRVQCHTGHRTDRDTDQHPDTHQHPRAQEAGSDTPLADPTAAAAAGNKKVLFFSFDDGPDPSLDASGVSDLPQAAPRRRTAAAVTTRVMPRRIVLGAAMEFSA